MSYTHTFRWYYKSSSGQVQGNFSESADAENEARQDVLRATTETLNLPIDVSAVAAFLISANRDLTLTVTYDDDSTLEVALKANIPFYWFAGSGDANPLVKDVVTIAAENESVELDAVLRVRVLYDPTPA